MSDEFQHLESVRAKLGENYLKWKEKYGDQITINFIDPRNTSMIASYLIKQKSKGHISIGSILRHLFLHVKIGAIFVNGHYLVNTDDFDKIVDNMIQV